jgi:hypothetical protein
MLSWSTEDTIKQEIASFSRETHAGTLARWHAGTLARDIMIQKQGKSYCRICQSYGK